MGFEEKQLLTPWKWPGANVGLEHSRRTRAVRVGEPGFAQRCHQALGDATGEPRRRGGRGWGVPAFRATWDSAGLLGGLRGGRWLGLSLKPQQG